MAAASIGFTTPSANPRIIVKNFENFGVFGSGCFKSESNVKRVCIGCCSVAESSSTLSNSTNHTKRLIGMGSKLIGSGSAVPKLQISNHDMAKIVETSDEWISVRTGIRNRRVLTGNENLNGLAVEAAKGALQMAEVDAENVDLIILCSSTPDDLFGGASRIQGDLGCKSEWQFNITAACSGFVVGLVTATRFIKGGGYKNILVIGADALSRFVDWTDRGTCILCGDAAGAVLVQARPWPSANWAIARGINPNRGSSQQKTRYPHTLKKFTSSDGQTKEAAAAWRLLVIGEGASLCNWRRATW